MRARGSRSKRCWGPMLHTTRMWDTARGLTSLRVLLLLYMAEEDAFWLFVTALDTLLPVDYFSAGLVGHHVDQVLAHFVKDCFPALSEKLEKTTSRSRGHSGLDHAHLHKHTSIRRGSARSMCSSLRAARCCLRSPWLFFASMSSPCWR